MIFITGFSAKKAKSEIFNSEDEQNINASRLFVLTPTRVVVEDGRFLLTRTPIGKIETVEQKLQLTSQPTKSTIAVKRWHQFIDVFETVTLHNAPVIYSDFSTLREKGITVTTNLNCCGIFPNDVIPLADYMFVKKHGSLNLFQRIQFLKKPFSDCFTLKDQYHEEALAEHIQYSVDELKEIREKLLDERIVKPKSITEVIRNPREMRGYQYSYGSRFATRPAYRGTEEENDPLKSFQNTLRNNRMK